MKQDQSSWSPDNSWAFERTPWSKISNAFDHAENLEPLIDGLCKRYWKPIFMLLCRKGYSNEDAQDITQSFLAHIVNSNALSRSLDQEKGSFRGFLRQSLNRFCINKWKQEHRIKRGGDSTHISYDHEDSPDGHGQTEPIHEDEFDRVWAVSIMQTSMERLANEMKSSGRTVMFEKLRPFLSKVPQPGEYQTLCHDLKMKETAIAMNVLRLRNRLREIVLESITEAKMSPAQIKEEMAYLVKILASSKTPW